MTTCLGGTGDASFALAMAVSQDAERRAFERGEWQAFDKVLMYINSLDTNGTAKEFKKRMYHALMEMRPAGPRNTNG